MPLFLPLAWVAVTALFACGGCSRDEEIQIGPEPPVRPKKTIIPKENIDLNNPIFQNERAVFTEQRKRVFLFPFSKESFQQDLSPKEKLSFRRLTYKTQRIEFFSQAYSFGKELQKNGKVERAAEVFRRLIDEKYPVPLEIRDLARRDLVHLYNTYE
jgi:hypothetical protein